MARNKQESYSTDAAEAVAQPAQQPGQSATGRDRITDSEGRPRIPDPILHTPEAVKSTNKAEDARHPNQPRTDVVISADHIRQSYVANIADARNSRLRALSRTSNDVAWLLAEYNKLSTAQIQKP